MTEVVTSTAAYVQPLLLPPKGQQAFGAPAPDSPQSELAIALAASQQQHALDATQVAATPDQPSLKNDSDNAPSNRGFLNQAPTSAPQAKAPDVAPPTTGPAKARVDLSVLDVNAAINATLAQATPAPAPKPATVTQAAPAAPAPAPATVPDLPDTSGVLGPAAVVKEADLQNLAQNIFGAAFAPTQVAQPNSDPTPTQTQKNFIFAHRKLFAEQTAQRQVEAGKFAAEDAKAAAFGTDVATGKFAAQPVVVATVTVGAQFAASAETAQKLFDKVQFNSQPQVEQTTGETRLYDKVPQADTDQNPSDQTLNSRQSLYQRAQAVAEALGDKGGNPAVKKLVATLETYALVSGVGSRTPRTVVRVTV